MDKLKERSKIEKNNQWDLELIYQNEKEFRNDLETLDKELKKLEELQGHFLEDKETFKQYLLQDEVVSRLLEKLAVYSHCKSDEDKGNSTYQELHGKVMNYYTLYSEITSSFIPQVLSVDKESIVSYLDSYEELEAYHYLFDIIYKKKEHSLTDAEEKILSSFQSVLSGSDEVASYLTNADLTFDDVVVDGVRHELSEASYSEYIKSHDRNVRKEAFQNLMNGYKSVKNTLAATYKNSVDSSSIMARIRHYDSSISMYLEPKDIPIALYHNLINTVHSNLDVLYDYYEMKKNLLGLDEFHLYDGYVKVIAENDKTYSFDEAKELILKTLEVMGKDYTDVISEAFQNRWIDVYPNIGKRSGAYSTGSYDTVSYILLNYTNTYNDVSTLIHELGHSMHTYYANKNNPYITASYPIFLAEIASTTNELLFSHYMYQHSQEKDEKLSILNERLDLFKATLYRQVMFAEFEMKVHEYVDKKNVLSVDYLCDLYYQLNQEYFGDGVVVDEEIQYEWLRIPHFYTPFYVYQYATSLSISCYIANQIIDKKPGFVEKYKEFLAASGRDYPLQVLKIIDIDLDDNQVFLNAIHTFRKTLDEFKKIYNEE